MKVNKSSNNLTFKRAFTTKEKEKFSKAFEQARKQLKLEETSAIIFDFNSPSERNKNYGLSSMNSSAFLPFIDFIKANSSINKIQAGPQSNLAYQSDGVKNMPTTSPYSGSTFTIGIHTIALEKLIQEEYGALLDEKYVKSLDENYPKSKTTREYKTDYQYSLGENKDGVIFQALKKAYVNFKQKVSSNDLTIKNLEKEYEVFIRNLPKDIEKEAYFDAISDEYHAKGKKGNDWKSWDFIDKYLFSNKVDEEQREKRLKELKENADFYLFTQFLAQKQHKETKKALNDRDIKFFGDCLVCFSDKEVWANPECFLEGYYVGAFDPNCPETNNIQTWGSPALDYSKLLIDDKKGIEYSNLGKTGILLYKKFKTFMQNYDGIRLDAFIQYVTPFTYNNKLQGKNIDDIDDKIIKIILMATQDATGKKPDPNNFVLEILGYGTERSKELTKNIFPHTYSTAYAEYDEHPRGLIDYKGYQNGKFTIGPTSHDNDTLVNISRNKERRQKHTPIMYETLKNGVNYIGYNTQEYINQSPQSKEEENFRTLKMAEVFTTKRQYFTLPDLFGMEEKINLSGKLEQDSWKVKIPIDYERFYYSQLSKGYGINFPKAYQIALISKGINQGQTLDLLSEAADILRSDGPMTTKEADEFFKNSQ